MKLYIIPITMLHYMIIIDLIMAKEIIEKRLKLFNIIEVHAAGFSEQIFPSMSSEIQ